MELGPRESPLRPRPAERGKGPLSCSEPELGLPRGDTCCQPPQPGRRANTEGLQGPGV